MFGKVHLAKVKESKDNDPHEENNPNFLRKCKVPTYLAIKTMDKMHIVKNARTKMVLDERNALTKLSRVENPRTTRLFMSFVDSQNLYLVLELCEFGALSSFCRDHEHMLSLDLIQNISGQILSAIEFMHNHYIIHCDLKPENLLIGKDLQFRICDFGCAMDLSLEGRAEIEFAGTADYVSPEVIKGNAVDIDDNLDSASGKEVKLRELLPAFEEEYAFAVDLWAFGCLLYFISEGTSPFHDRSDNLTIRRIIRYVHENQRISEEIIQAAVREDDNGGEGGVVYKNGHSIFDDANKSWLDLVNKLVHGDPSKRLGMDSFALVHDCDGTRTYDALRSHEFYRSFDWHQIDKGDDFVAYRRQLFQPFLPSKISTRCNEEMQDGACLPFDFFS